MFTLKDCFKAYTTDQDKAAPPAETVAKVRAVLDLFQLGPNRKDR